MPEDRALDTGMLIEIERLGIARVIPTARAAQLTMQPRRNPSTCGRGAWLADFTLCFCQHLRRTARRNRSWHWLSLHRKAGNVFIRKRPIHYRTGPGTGRGRLELCCEWRQGNQGRIIVEGVIPFDYEITQLTVRALDASGGVGNAILRTHRSCSD